jgi:ABC-type dipeptide/oligopeptide/nickel transport system permease subunit
MAPTVLQKLKKNTAAMMALSFIGFVILVAIFAYPLSADQSPNANVNTIELATMQPGFSIKMVKHFQDRKIEPQNFWHRLLLGTEDPYKYIPIRAYQIRSDSIFIKRYLDEQNTIDEQYSIAQLMPDSANVSSFLKTNIIQKTYHLGTDKSGRDMLSRLIIGTRVSLAVGFIAMLLSISIGVLLGAIAGYYGGKVDGIIQWFINVIWAIPTLLLVFAISFVLGKGFWQIFIAVGLTMWIGTARLIRGQVLSIKELEYIQAAKVMGFSSWRIITKHILPNVIGPTIVMAASNFATAILIEAGLSFLGVGVQPPIPSWGLMIKENYNFLITNKPLLALVPGIAIMLLVLAFNILGNALRDAFDVKL